MGEVFTRQVAGENPRACASSTSKKVDPPAGGGLSRAGPRPGWASELHSKTPLLFFVRTQGSPVDIVLLTTNAS